MAYLQAATKLWETDDSNGQPDHLIAPTLLVLGFCFELIFKAFLKRKGAQDDEIRRFGHDLAKMWCDPRLEELRQRAEVFSNGLGSPWTGQVAATPFSQFQDMLFRLSELHSNQTDYALRYPTGVTEVHPPDFMIKVAGELIGQ